MNGDAGRDDADLAQQFARVGEAGTPRERGLALADIGETLARGVKGGTLDEAIQALTAAREILPGDEPRRAAVALSLGVLLAKRHTAGQRPLDRDEAIVELRYGLEGTGLDAAQIASARMVLGLLLLFRIRDSEDKTAGMTRSLESLVAGDRPELFEAIELLAGVDEATLPGSVKPLPEVVSAMVTSSQLVSKLRRGEELGFEEPMATARHVLGVFAELGAGQPEAARVFDGMRAVLDSMETRATGDFTGAEDRLREMRELAEAMPAGLFRALLHLESGITRAIRGRQNEPGDDLAAAQEHLLQALAEMSPDLSLHEATLRMQVALKVYDAALRSSPEAAQEAVQLATRLLESQDFADPKDLAWSRALSGQAQATRAQLTGDPENYRNAQELLRAAAPRADDSLLAGFVVPSLGALLASGGHGGLGDSVGAQLLSRAADFQAEAIAAETVRSPLLPALRGVAGFSRIFGQPGERELVAAVQNLSMALDELPSDYAWRNVFSLGLGVARTLLGLLRQSDTEIREAVDLLIASAETAAQADPIRPAMLAAGGMGCLYLGTIATDIAMVDRAIGLMKEASASPVLFYGQRAKLLRCIGYGLLLRAENGDRPGDLDESIRLLKEATELETDAAAPNPSTLVDLCRAQHLKGDGAAVGTGLAALRAYGTQVLLQTGSAYGLAAAEGAADLAHQIAGWCVHDGQADKAVEALELGRGLVLHAATTATSVPGLLSRAGHRDLAQEWEDSAGSPAEPFDALIGSRDPADLRMAEFLTGVGELNIPSDLRHRVLTALAGSGEGASLTAAPTPDDLQAALRELELDALVYLLPGLESALVVAGEGPLTSLELPEPATDRPTGREDLCDWSWTAVMEPVLKALKAEERGGVLRVVLVPCGTLGSVPWHAARRWTPEGLRYACQDAAFSYIASGRQLIDLSKRKRLRLTSDPRFIANPGGDLPWASIGADGVREACYGKTADLTGRASVAELRDQLMRALPGKDSPGASMFYMACHGTTGKSPSESALWLSETDPLPVSEILAQAAGRSSKVSAGGLVVLTACESDLSEHDHDEALTLATAFLAAGATTVVGTRWMIHELDSAVLMFMFQHFLVTEKLPPGIALQRTQWWALDAGRTVPSTMPDLLADEVRRGELPLARVATWAAFTHQGR